MATDTTPTQTGRARARTPHAHLCQLDLVWEDRHANFRKVEQALDRADVHPGDLVVLPELFDSGFSLNTERTRDKDRETLGFLLRLADDLACTIHGSRTVRDCDCTHAENHATVTAPADRPDGEPRLLASYAKIHPFTYGREPEAFVGGREVVTYPWQGLTLCPAVCYDLRFPELFRRGLAMGAEAFVLGANWPAPRQHHWRALAIARAIENQAFVLAVNRVGNDPHLPYAGGSLAITPKGEILAEGDDQEQVLSVPIEAEGVRTWREEFPAWRDGRL